jgi:hypothetical protein
MLISNVSLTDNYSKLIFDAPIREFVNLKYFDVQIHIPKAPIIMEVIRQPPMFFHELNVKRWKDSQY